MIAKKITLFVFLIVTGHFLAAQSYLLRDDPSLSPNPAAGTLNTSIYQNGAYVGINTLGPTGTTEINGVCGTINSGTLTLTTNQICGGGQTYGEQFLVRRKNIFGVITNDFVIKPNGRIGIGTTSPTSVLDIKGQSTSLPVLSLKDNNSIEKFVLLNNGNVGIGVSNPTHKLTVAGVIGACEVIVENTWCDYVFAPEYKLRSIDEVEQFIKENRHLPGIPSEKKVIEEGLNLGDMQKMQMEKIEELTLYIIELKKEIDALKSNK